MEDTSAHDAGLPQVPAKISLYTFGTPGKRGIGSPIGDPIWPIANAPACTKINCSSTTSLRLSHVIASLASRAFSETTCKFLGSPMHYSLLKDAVPP